MARVFAVRVQIAGLIRVSRYKVAAGQVTSHVTLSFKGSTGAVGLQPNQITVNIPEIDCKNRDKPINFIVRVSGWFYCYYSLCFAIFPIYSFLLQNRLLEILF
jgi:hypothetical protein